MRYAEIALLMVPVGLAIAWACGIRGLSARGTLAALAALALLALGLTYYGGHLAFRGTYVPAHLAGDKIVPGHSQ